MPRAVRATNVHAPVPGTRLQPGREGAVHRGVSLARAATLMATKTTAVATPTMTTATSRRHEHPATRQGGYQRRHQGCAQKVFRLH
ncbi:conserved protein of unknown function [Pseudomonas putida KT2440]|uniref:Uncharacterized protein n=1 Tax=Pseudomonas putida (strain ATCC 47054 / DSM 6125 / CFBP 8728 / NCIMB 11950 / KT2440) TaxID=160488 RepID=Q88JW7_PSEPK|nr:conserved protein of unknown function [Pseudomonas putida KT2440]